MSEQCDDDGCDADDNQSPFHDDDDSDLILTASLSVDARERAGPSWPST